MLNYERKLVESKYFVKQKLEGLKVSGSKTKERRKFVLFCIESSILGTPTFFLSIGCNGTR